LPEIARATFEDARNAEAREQLLSMGCSAEFSLHMFEPAQLRL
jgi:hypothetical protein